MKAFMTTLLLFTTLITLFAQDPKARLESDVRIFLEQEKYYDIINAQDLYYQQHPDYPMMQSIRMYCWLQMNDMVNFRKEVAKQAKEGSQMAGQPDFKILTDKKYLAEMMTMEYMSDVELDSAREYRPKLTACDTVRGTLGPARSCYDVGFYDLELSVFPESRRIEGKNKIFFTVTEPTNIIQVDLFDNYLISSVKMDGEELNYSRTCQAILVEFKKELQPGEKACVEIEYSGVPHEASNPPWNGGFVWKQIKDRDWVGVACEQYGASSWWPLKDHLSDKPDSMRITLLVPAGYQAISNGNLRSVKQNGDNTASFEWFVSYPINSYNVTFYMGDFVNFNETFKDENGSYKVDYYVLKNHLKKAKKYYSQTKDILRVFSGLFGEYAFPRDGAGFVEAPFEGMEHQGAIAIGGEYGGSYLNYDIDKQHDYLLVHETAHEWWGNAVAVGDMADAWINEGFATYAEYLFIEKLYGYPAYMNAFGTRSQEIFNAWPLVGARGVNDNTFISNDIYMKGAAMLNNLRCIISNDSLFFSILSGFYEEYKLKISDSDDFIAYVRKKYPYDLSDFFSVFLYKDDPPVLEYSYMLLSGTLLFNYHWTGVGPDFTMPFAIVINDTLGVRLDGTSSIQRYKFTGAKSFYIPTPFNFHEEVLQPGSFTYFQTYWKRD
jgi:aminopeptidase N